MPTLQKTSFTLEKMDCPAEEQLVRMALEGAGGIRSLAFDLQRRRVDVLHAGDVHAIAARLDRLNLGSALVSSEAVENTEVVEDEAAHRRMLRQVLAINSAFFAIEMLAGVVAGSMGLVADSLDMLADSIVYSLSLYAIGRTVRHKSRVAALSGVFQLVLALLGLAEVVRRFATPGEVPSPSAMIGVSLFALLGNATCLYLLQKSRSREAHMQASLIFTSNDVIANIGVIVAGVLVLLTASKIPDLVAGLAIFAIVARGAIRIMRLARRPGPAH